MPAKPIPLFFLGVLAAMTGCIQSASSDSDGAKKAPLPEPAEAIPDDAAVATFAGGCFWCVEEVFHQTPGVYAAISGYTGGKRETANYEEVAGGRTEHAEAVQVHYDPEVLTYEELLQVFWDLHDPTQLNRQGPDRGPQYRSGIYYHSEEQNEIALASRDALAESGKYGSKPIVTEIEPATEFYPAENYHQNYARLNPRNPYLHYQLWPKLEKMELVIPSEDEVNPVKDSGSE